MKVTTNFVISLLMIFCYEAQAQISGVVFRDLNANGVKENTSTYNEPFVQGITVSAYPATGSTQTTTSDANGAYSFTGLALPVRIEFSGNPTYDYTAPIGSSNNSSVQFYSSNSTTADFGVIDPSDYQQTDPPLIIPRYRNGTSVGNSAASVYAFPYTASSSTPTPTTVTSVANVGSLWGVAIQPSQKRAFMSAVLKRHSGLGPLGLGGVYVFDYNGASPSLVGSFNLQGVSAANGGTLDFGTVNRTAGDVNYELGPEGSANIDFDAFDKVGKVGIGDADLSSDGNTLWLVNLNQKSLVSVDVSGATTSLPGSGVNQYMISTLANAPTCPNGELRPFGLEFNRGKGYVGMVCTAENSGGVAADLHGYVMSFDPSNVALGLTAEVDFGLTYNREKIGGNGTAGWKPWINTWISQLDGQNVHYPQPIISDIEIDYNGGMSIGLMDRTGNQGGLNNYPAILDANTLSIDLGGRSEITTGDIVKVCKVGTGWVLEGNPGCLDSDIGTARAGASNDEKTDDGLANLGEFYWGDYINDWHNENATGALAYNILQNKVVTTVYDPVNDLFSQGLHWYSASDGLREKGYVIDFNESVHSFGKANGLGDIELLVNPAPIEIGNRVWLDSDKDGVQDPDEVPIQGITVQLIMNGSVIATATTDAQGRYVFSNDPTKSTGTSTSAFRYDITQLVPNTAYTVHFPTTAIVAGVTYNLTTQNSTTGGGIDEWIDSDASSTGDVTILTTDIPTIGANNHTFDVGYRTAACSISDITATPGSCVSSTNIYDLTGSISFTTAPSTGTLSVSLAGGGSQVFNAPFTSPQTYSLTGLNSDGLTHTVTAVFSADPACTNSITYTAPDNCYIPSDACNTTSITAIPGACSVSTNRYSLSGQINFLSAPPSSGTIIVRESGGGSVTLSAPFSNPLNYTINNLYADGLDHIVNISLSTVGNCTNNVAYTAPSGCISCFSTACGATTVTKN
ncbi:MAG: hypothetical protein KBA06_00860 [Saprospiraceae bacterium]|nr:hypothetical protein [Saprospiraceae bacterium]